MAQDRVDKAWLSKGLSGYSTPAILGTLGHYGVELDEAGFHALAAKKFPLAIARDWVRGWRGTGQFARYPLAAAHELWLRLEPERLSPGQFSHSLVELVIVLEALLLGSADAPVGAAFQKVHELEARLPKVEGRGDEHFMAEVAMHMGEQVRQLSRLAEQLAQDGHPDDAEELAAIEELVFPILGGTSKAMVRAARGEKAEALTDLESIAARPDADLETRLCAIDALLRLQAFPTARDHGERLLDEAEAKGEIHLALEAAERVRLASDRTGSAQDKARVGERLAKLASAHAAAHPHHAH